MASAEEKQQGQCCEESRTESHRDNIKGLLANETYRSLIGQLTQSSAPPPRPADSPVVPTHELPIARQDPAVPSLTPASS